jgi:glucose dehydrogenase
MIILANFIFDFLNPITFGGAFFFDLSGLGFLLMAYGIRKEERTAREA